MAITQWDSFMFDENDSGGEAMALPSVIPEWFNVYVNHYALLNDVTTH